MADVQKDEAVESAAEAETPAVTTAEVEAPTAEVAAEVVAEVAPEAEPEEKPKATRARAPKADADAAKPKAKAPAKKAGPNPASTPKNRVKPEPGPYVRTPAGPSAQGQRRERRGVVVSSVEDKTITVRVDVMMAHPKYKKIMRRSLKLRVHDEANTANAGDVVRVVECKPMSKTKRWRLVEIVEVAK
jgi:small subunit ribosomal protein S17